jgi:LDH2 family malate/lactate/ureidoglycolate dehydrogenase
MTFQTPSSSKLTLSGPRALIAIDTAVALVDAILQKVDCAPAVADAVARHLADADLCGVESHGLMRIIQYVEQYQTGYLKADAAAAVVRDTATGLDYVDGGGGIGIPAMQLAISQVCQAARQRGVAVLTVRNVGHTGRLGAHAETAAEAGFLVMIIGGGGRESWRQVAPYGGKTALLPTNPYCMAIPGGERGPVVIDFATSMIAGGWLHSARAAGALVPEGAIVDRDGNPSRQPSDYFDGGAILPKGGPMGYGMALMAEMICDAMLGPASTECNWLLYALDVTRYRAASAMRSAAEDVLRELRSCEPLRGFERVEIPGERERALRVGNSSIGIALPEQTLALIRETAHRLGVDV